MSAEARAKISEARRRQEAMKTVKHGMYARSLPENLKDLARAGDELVADLSWELCPESGPAGITASQKVLLAQLRANFIGEAAVWRYAAARGLLDGEDLVPALKRVGSFGNAIRMCLQMLGLAGADGQRGPTLDDRMRTIEAKAREEDGDGDKR